RWIALCRRLECERCLVQCFAARHALGSLGNTEWPDSGKAAVKNGESRSWCPRWIYGPPDWCAARWLLWEECHKWRQHQAGWLVEQWNGRRHSGIRESVVALR